MLKYLSHTLLTHTPSQSQWVLQAGDIKASSIITRPAENSRLLGVDVLLVDEWPPTF
jgi:hypothetical protein